MKFRAAVLAVFMASIPPAFAEDGLVNAIARRDLPASETIFVRPLDNSDENLRLQRMFEAELRANGYRISKDSPIILTFEIHDQVGSFKNPDDRYLIELRARGSRRGGEDASARFNVFNSETGGFLNKGAGGETRIITPTKYRMDVTIDDAQTYTRFWQGWAVGAVMDADPIDLTRAMIKPLVRGIGQTVRRQPFSIQSRHDTR